MKVVDAVVVKTISNTQCPSCGTPVTRSPKPIGTPVRVDLSTRTTAKRIVCRGQEIAVEVVEIADERGTWMPCELLMSGGSSL